MKKYNFFMTALLLPASVIAEYSGTMEFESAFDIDQYTAQKNELLTDIEWNKEVFDNYRLTSIFRLQFDAEQALQQSNKNTHSDGDGGNNFYRNKHSRFSIRELYVDVESLDIQWRLGKQQVVWGQADGIKVLDQVNPQDYREFILDDFDDSRIPTWMVNAEKPIGDDSILQLLWVPDTTYHELPENHTRYEFSNTASVPEASIGIPVFIQDVDKPDNALSDSDIGIRLTSFLSGWDISANYLYHYSDFPVLYQDITNNGVVVSPSYERSHLLGGTLSNAFGDVTLRSEIGFNTDSYFISTNINDQGIKRSAEFSSVIGLDFQGLSDVLLSVQWFQSHLTNYDSSIVRDTTEHTFTLLYEHNFANETWALKSLLINSVNHGDGVWQNKLNHNLIDNMDIWFGADVFYGQSDGLYGQFNSRDRLTIGFELGF